MYCQAQRLILLTETMFNVTWPSAVALMATMSAVNGSRRQTPAGICPRTADIYNNFQPTRLARWKEEILLLGVAVLTFGVVCGPAGEVK